jgi:hypothetical protein
MSGENDESPDDMQIDENDRARLNAVEESYVKHQAKIIKEAAKKGNTGKARREAMKLKQYLGTRDNEMPIEDELETFE